MKRLLAALAFLVLLFLIWFFWSRQSIENPPTEVPVAIETKLKNQASSGEKTIKFKPQRREVKISLEESAKDVEVLSDENGVFITKIGEVEINKRVSSLPVERLTVRKGVMSFWEVNNETKKLKYRSLNLNALVDRLENQ